MKPPLPILTARVSWPRDTTPFPAAPKWLHTRLSEPGCRQHTICPVAADAEKTPSCGEPGGPEVLVWAGTGASEGLSSATTSSGPQGAPRSGENGPAKVPGLLIGTGHLISWPRSSRSMPEM